MYVRRTVRQLTKVIIITKKTAATIAKQSVVPEAVPKEVASKGSRRTANAAIFAIFGNFLANLTNLDDIFSYFAQFDHA